MPQGKVTNILRKTCPKKNADFKKLGRMDLSVVYFQGVRKYRSLPKIYLGLVWMLSDSPQSTCIRVDWGEI